MKKLLILCLALILCLSSLSVLSACNNDKDNPDVTTGPDATTSGSDETTAPSTDGTTAPSTDATTGPDGGDNTPDSYDLDSAKAYLKDLYKAYLTANETASDYDLVSKVTIANVAYTVSWAVNTDKITIEAKNETTVTVNVDEKSKEKLEYKLTATITAPDNVSTIELYFNLVVPKYNVLSYAEYIATEAEKSVVVEGIVIAVHSQEAGNKYNQLYIQDLNGDGGYYVYSMGKDPVKDLEITAGMTVSVTGTKDIYNGLHEIKNATVTVTETTPTTVTPLDITSIFASATSTKDANLVNKLGMLVTIQGVQITTQDLAETSQYYKFKLGDLECYVRIYDTDIPVGARDAKDALIKTHTDSFGYTATVTGVVIVYNGAIYLNPVSADTFTNLVLEQKSEAEKIATELDAFTIASKFTSDTTVSLPLTGTAYSDVKFAWTSSDPTYASIGTDGTLTITVPNSEVTVTLSLTITCGETTETKTYTLVLSQTPTAIDEILSIGGALASDSSTEEKYLVSGIITEFYGSYGLTYGNFYIVDGNGNRVLVYGCYDANGNKYDSMTSKPQIGDYVTVLAVINNFKGTVQLKNATLIKAQTPISIEEALKQADGTDVLIKGTVTEIKTAWNTQYKNLSCTISDGTTTIYVYRFGTNVNVGDTIVILGKMGSYNSNKQIAQGATLLQYTAASTDDNNGDGNGDNTLPEGAVKTTIAVEGTTGTLSDDKKTITWSNDYFTVTNEQAGSQTAIKPEIEGHHRVFASSKFSVTAKNGELISSISFTIAGSSYYTKAEGTLKAVAADGDTVTVNGSVVTITFKTPTSAFVIEKVKEQMRISSMEIVYTTAE